MFEIRIEDSGDITTIANPGEPTPEVTHVTIHIEGRFDASQIAEAEAVLGRVKSSALIDCSKLAYISSAGIGVLLSTYKRLLDTNRTFRLVNVSDRIRNVLTYAGLEGVFLGN